MPSEGSARIVKLPFDAPAEEPFYIPRAPGRVHHRDGRSNTATHSLCSTTTEISALPPADPMGCSMPTRDSSRFEVLLDGLQLLLLGSNLRDDNAWLAIDQTNTDIYSDGRLALQKDTVHVVRTVFLGTAPPICGWRCETMAIGRSIYASHLHSTTTLPTCSRSAACSVRNAAPRSAR